MLGHYFTLILRSPIKFIISAPIVLALIFLAITLFYSVSFAIYFSVDLKNRFYEKTGFYMEGDKIFTLLWDGKVEIKNVIIISPMDYDDRSFLNVKKLVIYSDYKSLLKGQLKIYGFEAEINEMNCYRKKGYEYNLERFLKEVKKISSFADEKYFRGIKLNIEKCTYIDASDSKLVLKRESSAPISLEIDDVSNKEKMELVIRRSLENSQATFLFQGIDFNK